MQGASALEEIDRREYIRTVALLFGVGIALIAVAIFWIAPFVFIVFTSFKANSTVMGSSAFAPPTSLEWANYSGAWTAIQKMSPGWWVALGVATVVNQLSYVWPYQAVLPGLRYRHGLMEGGCGGPVAVQRWRFAGRPDPTTAGR